MITIESADNYVFIVVRHPDVDHLSAVAHELLKRGKSVWYVGGDDDKILGHYIVQGLARYENFKCLSRSKSFIYRSKHSYFLSRLLVLTGAIAYKLGFRSASQRLQLSASVLLDCDAKKSLGVNHYTLICDHHFAKRKHSGGITENLWNNADEVFSLPHSYHYARNKEKYEKAFQEVASIHADYIGFYGLKHAEQVDGNEASDCKRFLLKPYRFRPSYINFKIRSYFENEKLENLNRLLSLDRERTVVFLDSPFAAVGQQLKVKEELLTMLASKYELVHIPHPRSRTKGYKTNATIDFTVDINFLARYFPRFVSVYSSVAIDLHLNDCVHVACEHLREEGYTCLDEVLGATLVANSNNEVLKHLRQNDCYIHKKEFIIALFGKNLENQ